MPDYLCKECDHLRVPESETTTDGMLRYHTACGYVVKEMAGREEGPEPAPAAKERAVEVFRLVSEWKSMDRQAGGFLGLAERLAAHVEQIHAAAFRAGQERMRERAGHEAEAFDVIHGRKVAHGIADAIRALPLEEPE